VCCRTAASVPRSGWNACSRTRLPSWAALTEPEQLRARFSCDVLVDGDEWKVGATITFVSPPEVIDTTLTGDCSSRTSHVGFADTWGTRRCASGSSSGSRSSSSPKAGAPAARSSMNSGQVVLPAMPLGGRTASTVSWVSTSPSTGGDRGSRRAPQPSNPVLGVTQEGPAEGYKGVWRHHPRAAARALLALRAVSVMEVVFAEERSEAPVLEPIERGPCLRGPGSERLWCGHCGMLLVQGIDPRRVAHLVFRCRCGAHNRPVALGGPRRRPGTR
jgi:hypothetical protein